MIDVPSCRAGVVISLFTIERVSIGEGYFHLGVIFTIYFHTARLGFLSFLSFLSHKVDTLLNRLTRVP